MGLDLDTADSLTGNMLDRYNVGHIAKHVFVELINQL